jgi:DNA-binding LytR/AlgR family response regulator
MQKPFFVRHNRQLRSVNPEDVMIVSTEKNYTKIYLHDKSFFMVRSTFANTLKKLPPDMFIQVDRSVAVSIYYMDFITRDHVVTGELYTYFGKSYYKAVVEQLNIIE